MPDLLDSLSKSDFNHFSKDFAQLIRVAQGMDLNYKESCKDLDVFMPRYKILIKQFNKKYKGIFLKTKKTTEEFILRIFIKDKSIKDIFLNAASRIAGLRSIGTEALGQATIGSDKFNREVDKIKNKVYISYHDPEYGSSTIFLEYDEKTKMIELYHDFENIANERDAEFKLIAFYALKDGFDKKIDIYVKGCDFSFNDWSEEAKKKFLDKYDPLLYE